MRPRPLITLLIFSAILVSTSSLSASLVITSFEGAVHNADGYSSFTTTTNQMTGLRVSLFFDDGSSDSGFWTPAGISQNGWTITQTGGSTFSNPFNLQNDTGKNISSFEMHGAQSSTIFDRGTNPSTAGTANGRDLEEFTNHRFSQDIVVSYFDAVKTTGTSAPVGDIFAGIDVAFSSGIGSGSNFRFRTDTDNTVNFVSEASTPEPTTVLTFSILMAAINSRRRRS